MQTLETKFLNDVPEDKTFVMPDGTRIKNLEELRDELRFMNNDVFSHHVNNEKNDFANWIRDVIGDTELAERMMRTKSRDKMFNLVNSRLIYLRIKAENEEVNTLEDIERKIKDLEMEIERDNKEEIENLEQEDTKREVKKRSRLLLGKKERVENKEQITETKGEIPPINTINKGEKAITKIEVRKEEKNMSGQQSNTNLKKFDKKVKITMSLLFILGVVIGYLIGKLI